VEVNRDSNLVIPNETAKLLQPLDAVISRSFKVTFRWLYNQWTTTTKHEIMPSGRLKHVTLLAVCEWMLAAWCSISQELWTEVSKLLV
jgi:hypothetical protein